MAWAIDEPPATCVRVFSNGAAVVQSRWRRCVAGGQSLNRVSPLNHLVGGREQRGRQDEASRFGDFEIDHEFVFGGPINRYVARFGPVETVIGRASPGFADIGLLGHQPTRLHVISVGIHRWWTVLIDQLDTRLVVGGKVSSAIYHDPDAR